MCSNFQPIKVTRNSWVKEQFNCDLPEVSWPPETYPTYPAPFIYLKDGKPSCDLAHFGLVTPWAEDKKKFGLKKYNARSETVHEKPSFRSAWKQRRFGIIIMESFYEPNWETGSSVRWRIKRQDGQPTAVASIWERFVDTVTGEIIHSFSMLTVNADGHEVMKHFHKPADEKRSVVVLNDDEYQEWLHADHATAKNLLKLTSDDFLVSEPAPIERKTRNSIPIKSPNDSLNLFN